MFHQRQNRKAFLDGEHWVQCAMFQAVQLKSKWQLSKPSPVLFQPCGLLLHFDQNFADLRDPVQFTERMNQSLHIGNPCLPFHHRELFPNTGDIPLHLGHGFRCFRLASTGFPLASLLVSVWVPLVSLFTLVSVWVSLWLHFGFRLGSTTKSEAKGKPLETNVKRETSGTQTETKVKPKGNQWKPT